MCKASLVSLSIPFTLYLEASVHRAFILKTYYFIGEELSVSANQILWTPIITIISHMTPVHLVLGVQPELQVK